MNGTYMAETCDQDTPHVDGLGLGEARGRSWKEVVKLDVYVC